MSPHDLRQLAAIDIEEEAIETDRFRHCRARTKQLDVILERFLVVHDGQACGIKQLRDIRSVVIVELLDKQLRCISRRAAEGVVTLTNING